MSSDTIDPLSLLYNTSFNLHKLTALSLNGALTAQTNLKSHSTRLANVLRGDVLRGVRVADSQNDDSASRTGALKRIDFTPITIPGSQDGLNAVAIVFLYEKITYSAFLVQNSIQDAAAAGTSSRRTSLRRSSARTEQSNHYPLLLTRLPAWLQSRFIEYMVENFDCHVSNLRLPDGFIMRAIENCLECFTPSGNLASDPQPNKNLQIWLEPPTISKPSGETQKPTKLQTLKTILMTFTREDIPGMMYKGTELKEKQDSEGIEETRGPFELALSLYAYHHMGVLVGKMRISKAACGEFIVGTAADGSGKCKFFSPKIAARDEDQSTSERRKRNWDGMLGSLVELAS
ncbi:hypothetical protein H072_10194 [Dactylellina haptotyla CBS 200.50]|uniref:Uncharacterized protein n=1 Tax=Dactylellina haptotyla (strain CBS 200.50) TaxID=1284197 RepID=S8A002_DACHA|nr:hypothetical protein H072_10194 [Dactylellina haptotyla CBS 200.50]